MLHKQTLKTLNSFYT